MKRCPKCQIEKADEEFHKSSRNVLQTYCNACSREIDHRKYLRYKDRILARNKAWNAANPEKVAAAAKGNPERLRKNRARAADNRMARMVNLPFTLTEDEWNKTLSLFGGRCAYCDAEGTLHKDHFIPPAMGGGYEAGNIIPACPTCNKKKWQHSPLKFLGIQKYAEIMLRIHGA